MDCAEAGTAPGRPAAAAEDVGVLLARLGGLGLDAGVDRATNEPKMDENVGPVTGSLKVDGVADGVVVPLKVQGDVGPVTGPLKVDGVAGGVVVPLKVDGDVGQVTSPLKVDGDVGQVAGPLKVDGDVGQVAGPLKVDGDVGQVAGPLKVDGDVGQVTGPLPVDGDAGATTDSLQADGDAGGPADGEEHESARAELTYQWQLAGSDATNGPRSAPLEFADDVLAKELASKRWRPQGTVRQLLEANHFSTLKKAPSHHKNAKYRCKVCDLHWDTLLQVQKHAEQKRHLDNVRRLEEMAAVSTLPRPTPAQTACLTSLLTSLYAERGLTPARLAARLVVAHQFRHTVLEALRQQFAGVECSLEVFGSARHGCGFASSCLDLALLTPDESSGAAQLTHVIRVLESSDLFTEVSHDFHSWVPFVRCVHVPSGQACLVGLGAGREVQLARLVALYTALDDRCAPLAVALRHLAKVCEMDRPEAGSLPPSAFVLMTVYYLQQCEPPVLPVLHELAGDSQSELDLDAAEQAARHWRTENADDLGTHWLRMLQFYALELKTSERVVSIRQRGIVTKEDKGWGNKKISIEDPVQNKRNIGRSISSSAVADVILDRLRAACLLFGVPRTAQGAAICLRPAAAAAAAEQADRLAAQLALIAADQFRYSFDADLLCGQTSMPLVCSICQKTGHVTDDCPTLVVPEPEPLPAITDQHTDMLDRVCRTVFNDWAPPSQEYTSRRRLLKDIEDFIRKTVFPSARLTLFGSSCNGFGFRNSDLDICMTFDDCEDPQTLDQAEIIKKLAHSLGRLRNVYNVIPITTAKVPIVKFSERHLRLEGDISLYNTLAQHNTLLLHTYARLDIRARVLGYMVKLMAKLCDIGDASRGSLSSYAYTLMMIYYLQRCDPPVLPVLQELDADARAPHLVDGWDVGFFSDLSRLRQLWPDADKNQWSVGQLWTGFLHFYGVRFDFDHDVVSIRRRRVLTKFEKLWNSAFIAIEDPFLLSHNLGAGVRRKMAAFIRRTLLRWRRHHCGFDPGALPHGYRDFRTFLMSVDCLCEGPPPNSNGCRECGRIGHWANECPRRRGRAATKEEMRQQCRGRGDSDQRYRGRGDTEGTQRESPRQRAAADGTAQSRPAADGAGHSRVAAGSAAAALPQPSADGAALLALLGACSAEPEAGRRRVPGTHLAESLERTQMAGPRPVGPPPGLPAPDLAQTLLAKLQRPAPAPAGPTGLSAGLFLSPQPHGFAHPLAHPQLLMQPPQPLLFQLQPLMKLAAPQPWPPPPPPAAGRPPAADVETAVPREPGGPPSS